MSKIILVAESGSDISKDVAKEYGIYIAPMHVAFGDETIDDGSFPTQKICDYYENTGKLPKTSGSTPDDFYKVFDEIHEKYPEAHILYLAYSAVTTCAYQSAMIAGEGRDYITAIDTKQVSIGQGMIVVEMAKLLKANPDMTLDEAVEKANDLIARANMCFTPNDLEFLRAGGRVSNVAFLGSKILSLHPCIELLDGKLVATKKYRGKMIKVASQLVKDYTEQYNLDRECLWCVHTIGLSEDVMSKVEETADECGFKTVSWIPANGVITTHGGPAAFGLSGFTKK